MRASPRGASECAASSSGAVVNGAFLPERPPQEERSLSSRAQLPPHFTAREETREDAAPNHTAPSGPGLRRGPLARAATYYAIHTPSSVASPRLRAGRTPTDVRVRLRDTLRCLSCPAGVFTALTQPFVDPFVYKPVPSHHWNCWI